MPATVWTVPIAYHFLLAAKYLAVTGCCNVDIERQRHSRCWFAGRASDHHQRSAPEIAMHHSYLYMLPQLLLR